MACISPSLVRQGSSVFLSPCGHCSQCIASKVSALTFLADKEVSKARRLNRGSSFITLTYSEKSLPVSDLGYPTLRRKDSQHFMMRFRTNLLRAGYDYPVKFLSCGEYGSDNGRPHMHFVIIGAPVSLAETITRKSWSKSKYGLIDVLPMTSGAVGYLCKYMSKSNPLPDVKAVYDSRHIECPFVFHSVKLGYDWVVNHVSEIIRDKFTYYDANAGYGRLFPSSVRRLVESLTGVDPRPYVQEYMSKIDTHGMPLDDFNTVRDYLNARKSYLKNVKFGKADYILSNCRLPPLLRSTHDDDFRALARE